MNLIDALGWTLLNFLWQGLLIGMLYAALRPQCRGPQNRYVLGLAALALCALMPIATLCWLWPSPSVLHGIHSLPDRLVGAIGFAGDSSDRHRVDIALPWLVGLWCTGIALLGARSIREWLRLVHARRGAIRVGAWSERIDALALRFGIRRSIVLLATAAVDAPILLGLIKPAILLPTAVLLRLPPAQLELIIAHELCHVRRWDYLVNLAQVVLETLLFYHPVVHWLSSRVRADRELCCDQVVMATMDAPPRRYVQALAELAEAASHLAPAASGGVLVERIEILLSAPRAQRDSRAWLPLLSLAAAVLLAFGMKQALEPATARHDSAAPTSRNLPVSRPVASISRAAILPSRVAKEAPSRVALSTKPEIRVADLASPPKSSEVIEKTAAVAAYKVSEKSARTSRSATRNNVEAATSEPDRAVKLPDVPIAAGISIPSAANFGGDSEAPIAATVMTSHESALATVPAQQSAAVAPSPSATVAPQAETGQPTEIGAPRVTHFVAPAYPVELGEGAAHGRVDLQFRIATDGSVQDIAVLSGADHPQLARAAVSALRQWRFAPESVQADHLYRQAVDFDRAAGEATCRTPTGSHICRHDLDGGAASVTGITR